MQPIKDNCMNAERCPEEKCSENCERYKDTFIRRKIEQKPVFVDLTEKELIQAGERLSQALSKQQTLEAEAKSAATMYKAKIEEQKAKVSQHLEMVQSKKELREVDVTIIQDYMLGEYSEVRCDNAAVLTTRPLNESEKQLHLIFVENVKAAIEDGQKE